MPSELCPALSCLGLEYGRRTTATNMDGYNDPAAVVNLGPHFPYLCTAGKAFVRSGTRKRLGIIKISRGLTSYDCLARLIVRLAEPQIS